MLLRFSRTAFLVVFLPHLLVAKPCKLMLSGMVKNSRDGVALSHVSVKLKPLGLKIETDHEGHFHFSDLCADKYSLVLSSVGFKSVEVQVDLANSQTKDIALSEDNLLLGEVLVKSAQNKQAIFAPIQKVDKVQIDKNNTQTFGELLQKTAGLTNLQTGPSIFKPMLHGMHSNRLTILNAGVKQEGQQWGIEHAPEIDPLGINEITIVKGASSLLYGPDAMGGAIVVEPFEFDFRDKHNRAGYLGSYATNGRAIQSGVKVQHYFSSKFAINMMLDGKYSGDTHAPSYMLNNTGTREYNGLINATYKTEKWEWKGLLSTYNTKIGILQAAEVGNLRDLESAIARGRPTVVKPFSYDINRAYQTINHQFAKSSLTFYGLGKWMLQYAYQDNLRREYDVIRQSNLAGYQLQMYLQTQNGDLTWQHPDSGNWSGTIGIRNQYQHNQTSGRYLIPNYQSWNTGLFAIEKYHLHPNTTLEFGARADYRWMGVTTYEDPYAMNSSLIRPQHIFKNWSANIGINQKLPWGTVVLFNLAKSWRPPSINELYSNGLHGGTVSIERGDVNMKAESSWNTNLDIKQKWKSWSINATMYYYDFRNYIYLKPTKAYELTIRGAFPVFQYVQVDARYYGWDGQVQYSFNSHVALECGYNAVRAYNKQTEKHLELIPGDRFNIQGLFNYQNHELTFGLNRVFRQTRVSDDTDFAPIPAGYTLFGASYWYRICFGKTEVKAGLTIQNLFNTSYREYLNRFRYYADDLGRNIIFKLQLFI